MFSDKKCPFFDELIVRQKIINYTQNNEMNRLRYKENKEYILYIIYIIIYYVTI